MLIETWSIPIFHLLLSKQIIVSQNWGTQNTRPETRSVSIWQLQFYEIIECFLVGPLFFFESPQ